jgi:hypothetical protein
MIDVITTTQPYLLFCYVLPPLGQLLFESQEINNIVEEVIEVSGDSESEARKNIYVQC